MRITFRGVRRTALVAAVAGAAALVVGCGGSSEDEANASASGSLKGNGKQVVFFSLQRAASPYIGTLQDAAKQQAEDLGYKIKIVETPFDQSVQNQQAQQFVASGQKPAAILWWPLIAPAGVNATRSLSRVAPVFQINTFPRTPEDRRFIKGYAGVSDIALGREAGRMLKELREAKRAAGVKLHSEGGNVIYFGAPAGSTAGEDRLTGFKEETQDEPFNLLGVENSDLTPEDTLKVASQTLPKYQRQGVDFIFVFNTFGAVGLFKAMNQLGMKPGNDRNEVGIVTGNCSGDADQVARGEMFGVGLQSADIEGRLAVRTVAQYLATGKVQKGDTVAPDSPEGPPALKAEPPHENTFLPQASAIGPEGLESARLWGLGIDQICPPSK